ncbi:MFS transporter [Candidatus Hodarchaeum mangrovi]
MEISSLKEVLFDLYLKPALILIGIYQIIVTAIFTAQQLLLAAYLDELNLLTISGFIIGVYFLFWFLLGPIFATLSDIYGRKFLLISSNWISGLAFLVLSIITEPIILFFMNGLIGIGTAIRIGSIIAFWIQYSPKNRKGESIAYINILIGVGGVFGTIFGFTLWILVKELVFIIFGILLLISSFLIFPLKDLGNYATFNWPSFLKTFQQLVSRETQLSFFLSKQMIQISLHWFGLSAIVSFGTYLIPIIKLFLDELPSRFLLPLPIIIIIGILSIISIGLGLVIWGRISDNWKRKPVLIIGYLGIFTIVSIFFIVLQFDLTTILINDIISLNPSGIGIILIFLASILAAVSLIPVPIAWITDLAGDDLAKAISLRQAVIGMATIVGTIIGGYVLAIYGNTGLMVVIFLFLLLSAIILL